MVDHLTPEERSRNMAAIRSKNTKPELIVRSLLHRQGFRFRLHKKGLPGNPDLVLPKYKTVIFVHGCFWHRHKGCKDCTTPKTRTEYWLDKFNKNVERDRRVQQELKDLGWRIIIIWQCEIKDLDKLLEKIKTNLLLKKRQTP